MQTDAWLGTLPAWVTAGIAFLALIAASTSAYFSYRNTRNQQKQLEFQQRQIEHQQGQLDQQNDDRRREQALRVVTWLYEEWIIEGDDEYDARVVGREGRIMLRNASEAPIYYVVAWINCDNKVSNVQERTIVAPGDTTFHFNLGDDVSSVNRARALVAFRDSHGVYWQRGLLGDLSELTESEHREVRKLVFHGTHTSN